MCMYINASVTLTGPRKSHLKSITLLNLPTYVLYILLCVYVCICMYMFMYPRRNLTCLSTHYIYVCVCVYIYIYIYTNEYADMYAYMHRWQWCAVQGGI